MSSKTPTPHPDAAPPGSAPPEPAHAAEGPPEPGTRPGLFRDASLSAVLAGFVAVVVSYSGPLVIVLAAASAGHLNTAQTSSWVWAISIGSGLTCIGLSLRTKMPVITAWSTPGAALLVTSLGAYSYAEAIGAFIVTGLVITLVGLTGVFGWLMRQVPTAVVSAMLAGILFSFGTGVFTSLKTAPLIAGSVLVAYLLAKRWLPRYAVLVALAAGVAASAVSSRLDIHLDRIELAKPVLTTPEFSLASLIGIAVPMILATLASQNAPGMAVLTASGYEPKDRLLIGSTGLVSTALAPFGSHAINLAAITAAICTGPESHRDPKRRYVAGVSCGAFYLLIGAFGSTLVVLFAGLPKELVAAVAGVALLGALAGGLTGAVKEEKDREAALITFLATASGVTLFGIGSAFWGLLFGVIAHFVLTRWRGTPTEPAK
ncbi:MULTISPECIES: benzoate/H(+) symporter BenE family transporter [Streptomyces]|uniref:Benzoate/H(+) symporter BenE family transporter n=1 Tax=Streptomyces nigrescens TaxID=1920 RepID=A0ABY7JBN1_STRNI|nr:MULTISPECIES: benzoate/H(+) symporter BenE family transporter [Streptomyces]WAU08624.1 benzoate/H(+) symporter BenE family transporter [Streptomyces nigrescens]WDT53389.1 benzoate/H(+) symporter BenE family transporter [Streptomyces sp. G7(2002)]